MNLLIDLLRISRWSIPLQILGLNAILLFVGSGLVGRVLTSITAYYAPIDGDLTLAKPVSLKAALYESLTFTGLSPINASLAFALFTLACWFCVLWYMWQRRWFWKV
jgi:predicted acyltransferase